MDLTIGTISGFLLVLFVASFSKVNSASDEGSQMRSVSRYDCRIAEYLKEDIAELSGVDWGAVSHRNTKCLYQNETMANKYINDLMKQYKDHLQGKRRKRAAGMDFETLTSEKWSINVIPYQIQDNLGRDVRNIIREAISFWERNTCLEFPESSGYDGPKGTESQYILFGTGTGCLTFVGRSSNTPPQNVFMNNKCQELPGEVSYLIAQVIGLWFEHTRPERDDHIQLIKDNTQELEYPTFNMIRDEFMIEDFDTPYDLDSITHHNSLKFTKDGKPTIVPHNADHSSTIGQRTRPSFYDVKVVNMLYQCTDICRDSDTVCHNDGYPNPNDCSQCICPEGLEDDCTKPADSVGTSSNGGRLTAYRSPRALNSPGFPGSYDAPLAMSWMITVDRRDTIALWFLDSFSVFIKDVTCHHWVEIKENNFPIVGKRVCGYEMPRFNSRRPYLSKNNEVLVNFMALTAEGTAEQREGFKLEYAIANDACSYGPCDNSGECELDDVSSSDSDYTCRCTLGYEGINCELIQSCENNDDLCQNDGACVLRGGSYLCQCRRGYSGDFCETADDVCDSVDCVNGECIEDRGRGVCNCDRGWAGDRCDIISEDFCDMFTDYCKNGGSCFLHTKFDDTKEPRCTCTSYWRGDTCTIDVDECSHMIEMCRNNGVCRNTEGGFHCRCQPNWTGRNCENLIAETTTTQRPSTKWCDWNICYRTRPCQNGGRCIPMPFQSPFYRCSCCPGYTGTNCEISTRENSCDSNPCQNGGTCRSRWRGGYSCSCPSQYAGTHCEREKPCESNNPPCKNGGSCINSSRSPYYRCRCVYGFIGTDCEEEITPTPPGAITGECGGCDQPLGTTAPACGTSEPQRCRRCSNISRRRRTFFRCTYERNCYSQCCTSGSYGGKSYQLMQTAGGGYQCGVTGCEEWGSCTGRYKYRTCYKISHKQEGGETVAYMESKRQCRRCSRYARQDRYDRSDDSYGDRSRGSSSESDNSDGFF